MPYTEIFAQVLNHIEDHLDEPLNADALAAVAGFSTYHFCRMFTYHMGCPVMEYVRLRRLAFAAHLLGGEDKIIDVALKVGFDTHSGFSKAFRRRYGMTPEAFRLEANAPLPLPPTRSLPVSKKNGGIIMEPTWITLPAQRIAGYALSTTNQDGQNNREIPAFWTAYLQDGRMRKLHGETFLETHAEYGACFPIDPATGRFDYLIAVQAREGAQVPEGYAVRVIPAAQYAVFATPPVPRERFSDAIQGTWNYIYAEWFPKSEYEWAAGCVDYELYDEDAAGDTGCVCKIHIPVVKKG